MRFRLLVPLAAALLVVGLLLAFADDIAFAWRQRAREGHRRASAHLVPRVLSAASLPNVLNESSGVAVSRRQSDLLWTHNDSGDRPVLYAVGYDGRLRGRYLVTDADARDWEDLALGPCPAAAEAPTDHCLYIADTGDNARRRATYTVYVVPEPDGVTDADADTPGTATPLATVTYVYPDGAHDTEGVAVAPHGDLLLVTKGRAGAMGVYTIDAATVARGEADGPPVTATFVATLPMAPNPGLGRMVTGVALDRTGRTLVVRTYTEVYAFPRDRLTTAVTPCYVGTVDVGGEAIDVVDDSTLVLTSESVAGRPGQIHRVVCPRGPGAPASG